MAVFSSKKALARCQDLRLLDLYHRSGLYTRYTAQNVQKRSYFRYLRMRNDETRINIKGHAAALYWPYTKKSRDLHPFPIPFLPLSMSIATAGVDPGGCLGCCSTPLQPGKRGCVNRHLTRESAVAPPCGQESSLWHAFDYIITLKSLF